MASLFTAIPSLDSLVIKTAQEAQSVDPEPESNLTEATDIAELSKESGVQIVDNQSLQEAKVAVLDDGTTLIILTENKDSGESESVDANPAPDESGEVTTDEDGNEVDTYGNFLGLTVEHQKDIYDRKLEQIREDNNQCAEWGCSLCDGLNAKLSDYTNALFKSSSVCEKMNLAASDNNVSLFKRLLNCAKALSQVRTVDTASSLITAAEKGNVEIVEACAETIIPEERSDIPDAMVGLAETMDQTESNQNFFMNALDNMNIDSTELVCSTVPGLDGSAADIKKIMKYPTKSSTLAGKLAKHVGGADAVKQANTIARKYSFI